jgi:alkanesulfonate monooxygenase SsuD/methylene tetrahydromethanopterin reductase-like flavin-dependent oxidoreductase (luciferase family)
MNYVYAYLSYYGYKAGAETMRGFWEEIENLGKEPNPYRAAFLQFVGVAETREEAYRLYKEPAEYFYDRCLHVDPRFALPPGYTTEATSRAKVTSQITLVSERSQVSASARQWDDIIDRGYVIIGSPDEVAEKLKEVARNLNVGHLMLLMQYGNMPKDLAMYNTKLFAERVQPQIQGMFDDQWQDPWWPQPMAREKRALPRQVAV